MCMEKKMDYISIKNTNEGVSSCRHYVIENPEAFLKHLKLVDCKIYKEDALDFSKLNSDYSTAYELDEDE